MSLLVEQQETSPTNAAPQPSVRPMTPIERQQHEDLQWAVTAPEVQQHEGKLVVVHKKRVVAIGTDQRSLLAQAAAQEQCPPGELVVELVLRADLLDIPPDMAGFSAE